MLHIPRATQFNSRRNFNRIVHQIPSGRQVERTATGSFHRIKGRLQFSRHIFHRTVIIKARCPCQVRFQYFVRCRPRVHSYICFYVLRYGLEKVLLPRNHFYFGRSAVIINFQIAFITRINRLQRMHIRSEIYMSGLLLEIALGQQCIATVHPEGIIPVFTKRTAFKRHDSIAAVTYNRPVEIHPIELYRSAEILVKVYGIAIFGRSE